MSWPCFWVEATGEVELDLLRYVFVRSVGTPCTDDYSLHNASVPIEGRHPARMADDHTYELWPPDEFLDDPRWPAACERCGYVFTADDTRYVTQHPVYRRPDTGEEYTNQRNLPVGALYDSQWYGSWGVGPDSIALQCVLPKKDGTPDHAWHIDGPARGEGEVKPNAWTRTGDPKAVPPTVDVNPSILTPEYHGHLRTGVLTDSAVSELGSIADEFVCSPECPVCFGDGIVCEDHPNVAWCDGDGCCGGAGMPCPSIARAREILG